MMVRVSAEQETNSLQMEANELRSLLLELQNNQTVIEKLQRQMEEIMEINTTLQREIMMVRTSGEQELANLRTQLSELGDLLNNLQQNISAINLNASSQPHLNSDVILCQNFTTTMEGGCTILPSGVTGSSPCATDDISIDIMVSDQVTHSVIHTRTHTIHHHGTPIGVMQRAVHLSLLVLFQTHLPVTAGSTVYMFQIVFMQACIVGGNRLAGD